MGQRGSLKAALVMALAGLHVSTDTPPVLGVAGGTQDPTVVPVWIATRANTSQTLGMHHAKIAAQATMVRG